MGANTIRLHRVLKAPPDRIYRAFTDASAQERWLPPYGFTARMHQFEPRVGGKFRMSFTSFSSGRSHTFGGQFIELTPNERIRYTDAFDDPDLPGEMQVTVELRPVLCGTEVQIEQAGVPDVIPPEMCYLGWQESLTQLANLVEPDIKDG